MFMLTFYQSHLYTISYFVQVKHNPIQAVKFLKIKHMSQLIFYRLIQGNGIHKNSAY